ncbi:MAG: sigma-54 dependent transcriptional regulator [Microscillaceae bacterium]|jgi:DNA-binding NtrC family response regulator|nr:sigma-54 dependent transcriptional regulator [Microscillaceae bacterium]
MNPFKIFIVEDDEWYAEILAYHLSLNPDYVVETFHSANDFLNNLHRRPSLITLDYSLPDMSGNDLLKKVKAQYPEIPIVIISGQEDISTAVKLLKEGAYDYIVKDDDAKERIWNTVMHARENLNLKDEITYLKEEIGKKYEFSNIIKGNSPAIKQIFALMEKAAKTNITVSVSGETGTGKELVAKAIHYNSPRAKKSFVAVNVAAIPKELIESELFGHEKGAFTGAAARRIGKFEEAQGGTIFLDEIGEMDLNMQSKLLRVLQEREVTRVGSNAVTKIDVRLIVATHKDLAEEVRKKNFREDLYYRLLGLPIKVPPLRQRGNDIILLAKFFVDDFARENKLGKISLSAEAQKKLIKYPFPGNVRELRAIMELSTVMANDGVVEEDHINFNSATTMSDIMMEETTLKEYTSRIIKHFLQKYDNNVLLVAEKLDIGKSTIYRMLKDEEL